MNTRFVLPIDEKQLLITSASIKLTIVYIRTFQNNLLIVSSIFTKKKNRNLSYSFLFYFILLQFYYIITIQTAL